jgi:8-oxo-dGTP pyrophosphatase MutT (NUDIX family)
VPRRELPVPPALEQRVRAWLDAPGVPVPPRPAATVALLRDAPGGPEVFLMRRVLSMAFAPGMVVFPGGGVDPRDGDDPDLPWDGPSPTAWAQRLGLPVALALGLVCAAVRETFEECGVLLATTDAAAPFPTVEDEGFEADRQRLLAREVALSDLLVERGLRLRSDLLRPWAHWTTPPFEDRRYDTWFLVAHLPDGPTARHLGGEASTSGWERPGDVLVAAARGEVALMPPTLLTLEELASAGTAADLVGRERVLAEVVPVPVRGEDGSLTLVVDLPAQPGDGA